jgi:hypothetical protein
VGRRTQCKNNVKQFALGCVHHLETHGCYPSGGWGYLWIGDPDQGFGRSQPGGWNYSVLPFVEQQTLHELGAGQSGAAKTEAFRKLLTTPVSFFHCPSRRQAKLYEQRPSWAYNHPDDPGYLTEVVKCDYAMSGGTVNDSRPFHAGPRSAAALANHNFPDISTCTGLHWWVSEFDRAWIRDGTSNTILLGEKAFDLAHADDWRAGDPQNPYIGHDPDVFRFAGPTYPLSKDKPGGPGFWVFGGPHDAGCIFAFADGRVQALPWTVDLQTLGYLAHRSDGQVVRTEDL